MQLLLKFIYGLILVIFGCLLINSFKTTVDWTRWLNLILGIVIAFHGFDKLDDVTK